MALSVSGLGWSDDAGEVSLARSLCNPTTELKMELLTMWWQ